MVVKFPPNSVQLQGQRIQSQQNHLQPNYQINNPFQNQAITPVAKLTSGVQYVKQVASALIDEMQARDQLKLVSEDFQDTKFEPNRFQFEVKLDQADQKAIEKAADHIIKYDLPVAMKRIAKSKMIIGEPEISTVQPLRQVKASATVGQNISDQQAGKAGQAFQEKLQSKLKSADPKSDLGQYYRASQLLNEYALYQKTGQGPLADDPEARELVERNLKFLQDKIKVLSQSKEVKDAFQSARQEALKASFGSQYQTVAKEYANYLLSDQFQAELTKMSPEQQKATLAKATLKLSALDPALAEQTIQKLAAKQIKQAEQKLIENLQKPGIEGQKAKAALKATLTETLKKSLSDGYDHGDKINKAVEQLMTVLEKNPRLLLSKEGFAKAIEEAMGAIRNSKQIPANLQKGAEEALKGLSKGNVYGSVLACAGLVNGIYLMSNAQNFEEFSKGAGGILSGVSGISKLGLAADLAADSLRMKNLIRLGALGPLGDALGVASDIAGAIREGANEDSVGQYLKGISAASGAAGAVAGIAILAGATGPLAPMVVGGAALIGLGTSVADYFFAESDKTGEIRKVLRDTGLSSIQDRVKAKYDQAAGYLYDDHQQMLKDFRDAPSAELKVRYINQLLDTKDVWISSGRAEIARKMLESLSAAELDSLFKNGLHAGALARKIGFSSSAATGIAQKLMATNTPESRKALSEFLNGLLKGGHQATLLAMLADPALGEKMVSSLSVEQLRDLINNAPDGKSAFKILEKSSWTQFNELIERSDGWSLIESIKNRLVNTSDSSLIGQLVAWGHESGASVKTRQKLDSWFAEFQKTSIQASNYGPSANAFVKELSVTQLQSLDPALKARLKIAFEVAHSHYLSDESREKLVAAGIL